VRENGIGQRLRTNQHPIDVANEAWQDQSRMVFAKLLEYLTPTIRVPISQCPAFR